MINGRPSGWRQHSAKFWLIQQQEAAAKYFSVFNFDGFISFPSTDFRLEWMKLDFNWIKIWIFVL